MALPSPSDATAVLVVSWNSRAHLARCLASLSLSLEIIVVDNASADGSAELVARDFPHVRLLALERNTGFAAAINAGARSTNAARLLLLNPDASATPGAVERLASFLDQHARCGAVGGLLMDEHQNAPQRGFTVRRFPTLATWAVDLLLIDQVWARNPITRRYLAGDVPLDRPVPVDQPAAACLMVRRAAFEAVGRMDEQFAPAWFEDVDLCRRLTNAGWQIVLLPDAIFPHTGGVAMRALGPTAFSRIWYRNLRRYANKHHGLATCATLAALIGAGMTLRLAVALARRDREHARAYLAVLRDLFATTRPTAPR